MSQAVSLKI